MSGVTPREVAKYAESIGIKGIGLYETAADGHFVHIDTRTTKAFWYGQAGAARSTFEDTSTSTSTPTPSDGQTTISLLRIGSQGNAVKDLQNSLNALGYDCGDADGIFGKMTDVAVKKFQKDNNLAIDGIVGSQTLNILNTKKAPGKYLIVTASLLNIRSAPSTSGSMILGAIPRGTKCTLEEKSNNWGKISAPMSGWICLDYTKEA